MAIYFFYAVYVFYLLLFVLKEFRTLQNKIISQDMFIDHEIVLESTFLVSSYLRYISQIPSFAKSQAFSESFLFFKVIFKFFHLSV